MARIRQVHLGVGAFSQQDHKQKRRSRGCRESMRVVSLSYFMALKVDNLITFRHT